MPVAIECGWAPLDPPPLTQNSGRDPKLGGWLLPRGHLLYCHLLGGAGWGKTEGCLHRSCTQGFALFRGHFVRGSQPSHSGETRRRSSARCVRGCRHSPNITCHAFRNLILRVVSGAIQ